MVVFQINSLVLSVFQCSHFLWLLEGQKMTRVVPSKKFALKKVAVL